MLVVVSSAVAQRTRRHSLGTPRSHGDVSVGTGCRANFFTLLQEHDM